MGRPLRGTARPGAARVRFVARRRPRRSRRSTSRVRARTSRALARAASSRPPIAAQLRAALDDVADEDRERPLRRGRARDGGGRRARRDRRARARARGRRRRLAACGRAAATIKSRRRSRSTCAARARDGAERARTAGARGARARASGARRRTSCSPRRRTGSPRSRSCSRSGSAPSPKASRARPNASSASPQDALRACPLGSGACSGSTLPLDRAAAARELGFAAPSRNALDAIGNRDVALDLVHAVARALGTASRVSEELVLWCAPAFGYARLDDAASTGSSLMPQKRNPDPFELVRAHAAVASGELAAALGTMTGIALSYHRDLQETKAVVIRATERGLAALGAFVRALRIRVAFDGAAMSARAADGYTVATDVADALVARGISARDAHALVGRAVGDAERAGRPLGAADLETLADAAGSRGRSSRRSTRSRACARSGPSARRRPTRSRGRSTNSKRCSARRRQTAPRMIARSRRRRGGICRRASSYGSCSPTTVSNSARSRAHRTPAARSPSTRRCGAWTARSIRPARSRRRCGRATSWRSRAARTGARENVPRLLAAGARVIDFSDAFRLRGARSGRGVRLARALSRRARDARLRRESGLLPDSDAARPPAARRRSRRDLVQLVVDAKSGVTGAGRTPATASLFAEVDGDVRAYGLDGHRHEPEIVQELAAAGIVAPLVFTPHVVPLARGMLADCYATFRERAGCGRGGRRVRARLCGRRVRARAAAGSRAERRRRRPHERRRSARVRARQRRARDRAPSTISAKAPRVKRCRTST